MVTVKLVLVLGGMDSIVSPHPLVSTLVIRQIGNGKMSAKRVCVFRMDYQRLRRRVLSEADRVSYSMIPGSKRFPGHFFDFDIYDSSPPRNVITRA